MTITQGVSCQVCRKQRDPGDIHPRDSRLIKGARLLICGACESEKKEPRQFIVIIARKKGLTDLVRDFVVNNRYVGEDITLKEVLK